MKMYIRNEVYTELRNDLLNNNGNNIRTILENYIKKFVYVDNVINSDDINSIETDQTPPLLSSLTTTGSRVVDTVVITNPQPKSYGVVGNRTFYRSDNYSISTVYFVDDTDPNNSKVYGYMDIPNSSKAIGQIILSDDTPFLMKITYIPSYSVASQMVSNIPFLVTSTFDEVVSRETKYDPISHSHVSSYLRKLTSQSPVHIVTRFKQN